MSATVFFESSSELATLSNTFSVAGVATDPTAVSLAVTDPTGTTTPYTYPATITKTATGAYTKDVACSIAGTWTAVWTGTGTASDLPQPMTWEVFPTALGNLYAPPAALKAWLKITTTTDDLEIHQACFAASRWIEQHCERIFYRTAAGTVRTFAADDRYRIRLPDFSDLVSVSALATDEAGDGTFGTTWSASDYQLLPVNPSAGPEVHPYTAVRAVGSRAFPLAWGLATREDRVQITGVFGWPAVPSMVKQAALLLAVDALKTKETSFGVGGANEWGLVRIRENPIAMSYLNPYRRNPVLVY